MDKDALSKKRVYIPDGEELLEGELQIPIGAKGCVVFTHGGGNRGYGPRNYLVAKCLRKHGFVTLRLDLLTPSESAFPENRYDIGLLSRRLIAANEWLKDQDETKSLRLGYFASNTGSAAAITAAVMERGQVSAIVSRGGRPDLAWDQLGKMDTPILFIVGGFDDIIIKMNEKAYKEIQAVKRLEIIPRATHLFEEPGTLEKAANFAAIWFEKYL
ncbi:MAG: dienelactone hydrolase family protein [Clostridiaceae bacterium]